MARGGAMRAPAAKARRLALIAEAMRERRGDAGGGRVGIVLIIAVALARQQRVHGMMPVVVPFGVEQARAALGVEFEQRGRIGVVLDGEMDVAAGEAGAHLARDLGEDRLLGAVLDVVDGVEAQAVEAELLEPIEHVVEEEIPHRPGGEFDRLAPGRLAHGIEEARRGEMEVIPVGAEMVIDHVEKHHQPALMRGVDETLQPLRVRHRPCGAQRAARRHSPSRDCRRIAPPAGARWR